MCGCQSTLVSTHPRLAPQQRSGASTPFPVKHPRTSHTSALTRVNTHARQSPSSGPPAKCDGLVRGKRVGSSALTGQSHRVSPHLQPSLISPNAGSVGAVAHEHGALSRGATCAKGQMADDRTQGHPREQQRMHAWQQSMHATELAKGAGRGCSLARGRGAWARVERAASDGARLRAPS